MLPRHSAGGGKKIKIQTTAPSSFLPLLYVGIFELGINFLFVIKSFHIHANLDFPVGEKNLQIWG